MLTVPDNVQADIYKVFTGIRLRPYQIRLLKAIFKDKKTSAILNVARRGGKDFIGWLIAIIWALSRTTTVFYIFPTRTDARSAIWNGITNDGRTFLSFIPDECIRKKNESMLEIHFRNGSILSLKGSNKYNSLRGNNPTLCIFSEYGFQDQNAYPNIILPVIRGNHGTCIFLSTPFGFNHFYELFSIAQKNPHEWHCEQLTIEDIGHISADQIRSDIEEGLISEDRALSEYYCQFSRGVEGSIFGRQLQDLVLKERIGFVPYDPIYPVNVVADIGWDDDSAFIFFQVCGQQVNIIDSYRNRLQTMEFYGRMIMEKNYNLGILFLPHDAERHSDETGNTRTTIFRQLGFRTEVLKRLFKPDQIELGRCIFSRLWINEKNCEFLMKALENYRREWDDKLEKYVTATVSDKWSHFADAFMYMAQAVPLIGPSMTQEDANALRDKALAKHKHWGYR